MINDSTQFESKLRSLYAEVAPPPAPKSWTGGRATQPRLRTLGGWRPGIRLTAPRMVAVGAAIVVAVVATFVAVRPTTGVAVTVLPAGADLACRLPVSALSSDHTTGFVVLDHGQASFQPVQTAGTTYIPALRTWAPVLPQMVAPDGRSFVSQHFSGGHTVISVTDANGSRTLLDTMTPINLFGYSQMGILVIDMSRPAGAAPGPSPALGLKVLDPTTGAPQPFPFAPPQLPLNPSRGTSSTLALSSSATYNRASNAIWLLMGGQGGGTTVSRYDLSTGRTIEWLDANDLRGTAEVVGADAQGAPIIQVAGSDIYHTDPAHRAGIPIQTLLVPAPHQIEVLNQGQAGAAGVAGAFSPLSVTDGTSVWLASNDGAIWLYRPASGLQQIAKVTTSNQGAPGVSISGACS
jgi:hypothetical protein